jgi:hypothetical protein
MPAGHQQHHSVRHMTCARQDVLVCKITIYIHHGTGGRLEKLMVVQLVKEFSFHGTLSSEVSGFLVCYTEQ